MWLKDESCEEVVRKSWENNQVASLTRSFNKKIISSQENLKLWNRDTFGHVQNSLEKKLLELKTLKERGGYRINPIQIQCLREEINTLKAKEECMWKKLSRNAWLKEGDSSTRYFHCRANQRNRRNLVLGIEDEAKTWVERYFETMFTTLNPLAFEDIINGIRLMALDDEEANLGGDFQAFEVYQALKQMASLTALGPDGMSLIFYNSF